MWQCTWWPKKWGRLVWILDSLKSAIDLCDFWHLLNKQELSYRKQIARKLRTQFVEGISVTLKSRLRITQGHWKRNHSVDHTRLTISRVIWRWILSWPWNLGQRSLKVIEMVPFESLGTVSYSPSMVTMAVSVAISEIFNVKEWSDLEIWIWGRSRSLKMCCLIDHVWLSMGSPL